MDESLFANKKEAQQAIEDQKTRQRFWCKRRAEGGKVSWRPKKKHRVSACHWAMNVDNQIKISLGLNGLKAFVPSDKRDWTSWRHMNVAIDQGGDGLSACNWLMAMGCCLTIWCDFSHGANNDINGAIKELGLWSFWLLMLVTLNVPHGPWDDDVRNAQAKEGWEETKKHYTARSAVLFQDHLPHMVDEMKPLLAKCDFTGPIEEQIWMMTSDEPALTKKGTKKKNARFLDVLRGLRELLPLWSLKLMQYEHVCIELGMVSEKQMDKLSLSVDVSESDHKSTAPSVLTLDDKIVRGTCQNALVIACAMLGIHSHKHLINIIVNVCKPVEAWHSEQNKQLRSEASSAKWILDQLEGDFFKHVNDTILTMQDPLVLAECGIAQNDDGDDNCFMMHQNELSSKLGDFALLLASKRVQRTLWFVSGLPHRLPLVLSKKTGVPLQVLKEFKRDYQCHNECIVAAKTIPAAANFVRRSVFKRKSVDLHVKAMLVSLACLLT